MTNLNIPAIDEPASRRAVEPEPEPPRDPRTHASAAEPDDAPREPERIPPATDAAQAGIVLGNANFLRVIQAFDGGEAIDLGEVDPAHPRRAHRDPSRSKLDHLSEGDHGDHGLRIGCAHWKRSCLAPHRGVGFFVSMWTSPAARAAALDEMQRYFRDHPEDWNAFLRDISPTSEGEQLDAAMLEKAVRATLLNPTWVRGSTVGTTATDGFYSRSWFRGSIQQVLRRRAVARWESRFWWDEIVAPAIARADAIGVTTIGGRAAMVAMQNSFSSVLRALSFEDGEIVSVRRDDDGNVIDTYRYVWDDPPGCPEHVDPNGYRDDWRALVMLLLYRDWCRRVRERATRIWDAWYRNTWGAPGSEPSSKEEVGRAIEAREYTGQHMDPGTLEYVADEGVEAPPPAISLLADEDPTPIEVTAPPHVEPADAPPREDPLLDLGFPLAFVPTEDYRTGDRAYDFVFESGNTHAGCDLVARPGRPVHAVDDGEIVSGCEDFWRGTQAFEVLHDAGFTARYCQVQGLAAGLRQGERVTRGQVIAYVGRPTRGTCALHFEMYWGSELTDPTPHLTAWERNLPVEQLVPCTDECCVSPRDRSEADYNQRLDALDVENNYIRQHDGRHGPTCTNHDCTREHTTHCNVFAMAAMDAMGLEYPHRPGGGANEWTEWMQTEGQEHGWRQVNTQQAMERASQGYPTLALWPGMPERYHGAGHVAVVRPGGEIHENRRPFWFTGPTTAQAGSWNWNRGGLSGRTVSESGPHQEPTYWTHN